MIIARSSWRAHCWHCGCRCNSLQLSLRNVCDLSEHFSSIFLMGVESASGVVCNLKPVIVVFAAGFVYWLVTVHNAVLFDAQQFALPRGISYAVRSVQLITVPKL